MSLQTLTLALVILLIAIRRIGPVHLRIWQIMAGGALVVLAGGAIPPGAALAAIDFDVLLFLAGMFVLGAALQRSGLLMVLAHRLFRRAGSVDSLMLLILFGMGLGSALLMNDTLAVIGTPLMLLLAREHGLSPRPLLLALCYAITTGSVMSPIGNPQNLLIALHGPVDDPFVSFAGALAIPTLLNLLLAWLFLRITFHAHFHDSPLAHAEPVIGDRRLARCAGLGLGLAILMVVVKILAVWFAPDRDIPLTWIALAGALPVLLLSARRLEMLRQCDWRTLVFFAALFVLMESVWRTGSLQRLLAGTGLPVTDPLSVLAVSVGLSQIISNVPMVALYLPVLQAAGATTEHWLLLAAGSTIAGNLLLIGAASNVIVVQNAERQTQDVPTFADFARIGVPLTAAQTAVYWAFLG